MLTKGDIPKLLLAGMRTTFMKAYETAVKEHDKIATTITSVKSSETYPWLGGVPRMREWKDERIPQGMLEHNFTIINRDWESSIAIDRNAIEDEQYGQIDIRIKELATEATRFFDELAFTLIGQGNNTAGTAGTIYEGVDLRCYDGKAFFASDHSEGESGTQTNKGTTAIGSTALTVAITAMRKFKNDKGKPAGARPDLLVVPPELEWTARELLNSSYFPETVTNMKLAINVLKGTLNLLVNDYLADANDWFIFDTRNVVKPLILQMRQNPKFSSLTEGTEASFMRKMLYYGINLCRFKLKSLLKNLLNCWKLSIETISSQTLTYAKWCV